MRAPAAETFSLTAAQRDIWLDQISRGDSPLYNIGGYLQLTGPVDPTILHQALDHLVAAHESLRTVLVPGAGPDGLPLQSYAAAMPQPMPLHDFRDHPEPEHAARALVNDQMRRPYTLDGSPLVDFCLIRVAHDRYWLVAQAHHLILDGWGFGQLFKSLGEIYSALRAGERLDINAPGYSAFIADDALYQASKRYSLDEAYWLEKYRDLPEPLLVSRYHNRRATDPAPSHAWVQALPQALHVRMKQFAERHNASAFHVLLAVLHVYFTRTAQRNEWVAGLPLLNRSGARFKATLGHFAQVSAVRMAFAETLDFGALVVEVRDALKRDFRHQRYPLSELNRSLELSREERAQLFEVSVSYELEDHDYCYGEAQAQTVKVSNGYEATPLAIHLRSNSHNDEASLHLVHHRAWVEDAEAQAIAGRLLHLLEQGLESPQLKLQDFRLSTPAEQSQIQAWNQTHRAAADEQLIHRRIEQQARTRPYAVAAVYQEQYLTYAQLNRQANALAQRLIYQGVRPDDRVAVVSRRGLETLVGLLAVLKAGAAYVPIDPSHPRERLHYLLSDSAPVVVLTLSTLIERLPPLAMPLIELDHCTESPSTDSNPLVPGLSSDNLVYVIYTSGSTGQPKGVMVEHRTLANLVDWHCNAFDVKAGSHTSCLAGFGFDAMAWELWPTLCAGATLHLAPVQDSGEDIEATLNWWRAQPLDVSFLPTPVAEYAFSQAEDHPTLRTLLIGGDRLRQFVYNRRYAVVNNYGPTETTVVATSGRVMANGSLHIGGPVANTRVYVLDERLRPMPVGVPGELYIGGAGVARGYLNQPQLTEARFVADPFSDDARARMYRSGDLVRWNADGTLDYLGRNDDQVKIRCMRIEPGEIEAVLTSLEGVKDAVVLVRDLHLLAWFTETSPVDTATLSPAMRARLPGYMVPRAFTRLASLPLTANGKLDRRALPDPDPAYLLGQAYEAPKGEVEIAMAAIWAQVLGVERVGRHDNFFELGGHSLLAVNLVEQLRHAGLAADVHVLLSQPTLAALAACQVDSQAFKAPANLIPPGCTRITPEMLSLVSLEQTTIDRIVAHVPGGAANVQDIYPLAPLQEGILYHHLTAEQGDPYLLQWRLAFDTPERLYAWAAALQHVINRHDILRTSVVWEGLESPQQVVWRNAELTVQAIEFDAEKTETASIDRLQRRFDARHHRLDLSQAPLMRLVHAREPASGETVAILLFHHLVLDNTAMEIVSREMQALLFGQHSDLKTPVPYRNYVAQVRLANDEADHAAFFREMLGDVEEPTLPFGVHDVRADGSGIEEHRCSLDRTLALRLREQARQLGVSAASLMHVTWARVLGVLANRRDVVFGTVLLGRMGGEGADRALGVFINTLPLRVDTTLATRTVVQTVHSTLSALIAHEQASLVLAQGCSAVAAGSPLFSALLNYRHSADVKPHDGEGLWQGVRVLGGDVRSNYPLTLSVDDLGEGFDLQVLALQGMGAKRIAGWVLNTLEHLLETLEEARPLKLDTLSILDAKERSHLLRDFNASEQVFAQHGTVQALIEAQAASRPDSAAVIQGGNALTYAQLNERANRLAHHLIGLGVTADERVALCLHRGPQRLVAMLAVLKAGAAYVPVDPVYPTQRIAYLLDDSAPRVVLTEDSTCGLAGDAAQLNIERGTWLHECASNPYVPGHDEQNLAYVIYTSGSTGQPKGVMVEHCTLVNLVHWHCQAFDLQAGSHTASVAGFGFDAMAWEVWPALCVGAVLHLPPAQVGNEHVDELLDWWLEQPLQVSFLPTPVAEQAFRRPHQHPTLRTLLIGGDRLRQFDSDPGFAVINNYGPTETTVVATSGAVKPGGPLHIGGPIANTCVYVLDEQLQPVPVGVIGELYIGGAGVARGYLNRPQMTEERFVIDPFSHKARARLYRSGDLVRWNADGSLDYLGRNDDQVKIRGMRIELGEIESALTRQAEVKDAVVLVRGERLLAWFTENAPVAPEVLREALRARLPAHMVPLALTRLDALPLTSHGKLDRRALPDPELEELTGQAYEAPRGETETVMAGLWAQVLGLEKVGRHDNFFELGGHSLLAVSLVERLRNAGLGVDVRVLLGQPTVAALATSVGKSREISVPANRVPVGCTHITPDLLSLAQLDQTSIERIVATVPGGAANVQEIYPLAPLQEGILYHHLTAEQGDPYLLQLRINIDTTERLEAVADALRKVIARHDSLRTAIVREGLDAPHQVVWRQAELMVERVPLAQIDAPAGSARMDLSCAPLIRLAYCPDATGSGLSATLMFHHIVVDATALDVMREEMLACLRGEPDPSRPAVPYRNYVAQARLGVSEAEHEAYFREQLGDIDEPTLPFDLRDVQGGGHSIEDAQQLLPDALSERLRSQARQLGVSVASLFHLAWARVLAAATGTDRVVFGTVLLGRLQGGAGADRGMGMFINTLPLRIDLETLGVREGARATHARLAALLAHEHASLAQAQRWSGVAAPLPLFSAILNYRHAAGQARQDAQRDAWRGLEILASEKHTNYPLSLNVDDLGDSLRLNVTVPPQVGAQRICGYVQQALTGLVDALECQPDLPVQHLSVLDAEERQRSLVDFNATEVHHDLQQTLQGLFEAQAVRTPHAVALRAGRSQLSYRQLNEQANCLAHHLIDLGVQPDDRVAICVERGMSMVVGLLAILKAGGAYVPLDPSYPRERLHYMVKDSAPVALLVHTSTRDLLECEHTLRVDLDSATWDRRRVDNPRVYGLTPNHLAYVIYTSGSTGTPKGVMVEHCNVSNLVQWSSRLCPPTSGSALLQKTPISFDASVWEIFWPLTSGIPLVLARPDGQRDPSYVVQVIQERQVSVVQFVPVLLQQFLDLPQSSQCHSLTDIVCGGGELTTALARQLRKQLPQVRLHNVYGPTETTVDCSVWTLEPDEAVPERTLPIGRPISNTRLYVLDAYDQPVPQGVIGQLHIGGAGVTRGYLNLPHADAERFIDSPFVAGDRLYRSGDLVRQRAGGNLEFLGRNDDQVKIHGLRIEPGDIQACLTGHPGIEQAVVLVRDEQPGGQRMVAYYTGIPLQVETLREVLRAQLPDYMVPALFVHLDAMPLSPNGKLDRKALPAPSGDALPTRLYEAPEGATEVLLARLWSELLGVGQVGRHDNFFELGGHSLLAVNLTARLRQEGIEADVRALFEQPTLAGYAAITENMEIIL
ncbi:non-ribosomal peptide synthetase [Pseudomonas syringae pv. tagetis]|uniref:Amino acid adenylation n=1 Tax=Pseudomonas syringae pv. tagetis TaxID=129140 RepID=A0A0N8T3X5_9PSED|nr:non-ribosomal peptide synthetase [Pseudomonas syringae group genomosp. 7]KPY86808.1 Amino acid adenylation [Pseudomonas syringae pv. tagetis]RMW11931.1 Amino acid adenylation [Pseudomonas syringae pv. tagetis]RMW24889.1 Amino acid adenylation [Pseudomonas syringae pv. tagetis]UNB66277.1 non-ribosomal peptide synthetase [Pseudomonas syringae pv. tagetis]